MAWRACFAGPGLTPLVDFEHSRQDPFRRPPLLYKDLYSTHHIHNGNKKDVLYIRKAYDMNKIHTKLRHSLPSRCESDFHRQIINTSAANVR